MMSFIMPFVWATIVGVLGLVAVIVGIVLIVRAGKKHAPHDPTSHDGGDPLTDASTRGRVLGGSPASPPPCAREGACTQ